MNFLQKVIYYIDKNSNLILHLEKHRAKEVDTIFNLERLIQKNSKVLDIGCGIGDVTNKIASYTSNTVVGMDIEDFRRIGLKQEAKFKYVRANIKNLPFKIKTFDKITLFWTLHHIDDPLYYINSIIDLLNDEGEILVIEDLIDDDKKINKYFTKLYDKVINLEFRKHPHSNLSMNGWLDAFSNHNKLQLVESFEYKYFKDCNILKFGFMRFRLR